jgi:glucose-1-phosphate cytidylyltransferase
MKTVLLAGGLGTRLSELSNLCPKPMVEIGGMPILWHIMKCFAFYGHTDFIVCAGYRQDYVKEWFANYFLRRSDVTFDYRDGENALVVHRSSCEPWRVTVVDTGFATMTGGRIKRIRDYVENERFFMTYGDAVCDVNINRLLDFHKEHGKLATLTAVKLEQEKGVLNIGGDNAVKAFREKNLVDALPINAGFMVLEPAVFDYIDGDDQPFEREPLEKLAKNGQLMSYVHNGFWQCMDNIREKQMLEKLLISGHAPWKVW